MKKEELNKRIENINTNPLHKFAYSNDATATAKLIATINLLMELTNDFNESTNKYNKWLIRLTWVIAILTAVMVWKMLAGRG